MINRRYFCKVIAQQAILPLPKQHCIYDHVDLVEINHLHDDQAKLLFSQIIWWDFIKYLSAFRVVDWRIVKHHSILPRRVADQSNAAQSNAAQSNAAQWTSKWFDSKDQTYRQVSANFKRETHTWWDPELEDREHLPQKQRRLLTPKS